MFDLGWSELFLILIVAVFAIGPKQIPELLYGLGRIFRRLSYMKFALSKQFDDFMDQTEIKKLQDSVHINEDDIVPPIKYTNDDLKAEQDEDEEWHQQPQALQSPPASESKS
jgi:Sec-independent protein translocase protein TatA